MQYDVLSINTLMFWQLQQNTLIYNNCTTYLLQCIILCLTVRVYAHCTCICSCVCTARVEHLRGKLCCEGPCCTDLC